MDFEKEKREFIEHHNRAIEEMNIKHQVELTKLRTALAAEEAKRSAVRWISQNLPQYGADYYTCYHDSCNERIDQASFYDLAEQIRGCQYCC